MTSDMPAGYFDCAPNAENLTGCNQNSIARSTWLTLDCVSDNPDILGLEEGPHS